MYAQYLSTEIFASIIVSSIGKITFDYPSSYVFDCLSIETVTSETITLVNMVTYEYMNINIDF